MLPTYYEYGGWPASGEIDIVESRGELKESNLNENENKILETLKIISLVEYSECVHKILPTKI